VLEPPQTFRARGRSEAPPFQEEYAWVRAHGHEHPGCWLGVQGSRLLASGPNIGRVRREAMARAGHGKVLFVYQPAKP
jgi:hypothetical protein